MRRDSLAHSFPPWRRKSSDREWFAEPEAVRQRGCRFDGTATTISKFALRNQILRHGGCVPASSTAPINRNEQTSELTGASSFSRLRQCLSCPGRRRGSTRFLSGRQPINFGLQFGFLGEHSCLSNFHLFDPFCGSCLEADTSFLK